MSPSSGIWCAALLMGVAGVHGDAEPAAAYLDIERAAPAQLGAYNLFKDPSRQTPRDGVLPYGLSTELFSDHAVKHRFVWMPKHSPAKYRHREVFDFPEGTLLVKTFGFHRDERDPSQGERLVETRLLLRRRSGWAMLPYVWNDDGTDARLAVAGARVPVTWIDRHGVQRSLKYVVPNMNQCKHCHVENGAAQPIGPKARYLNYAYAYTSGVENQLDRWIRAGLLSGLRNSADAPKAPRWDDPASGSLAERARAYLDINCAHCHNPAGPAYTSGLDLSYDQTTPVRIGIRKAPVAAGRGASIGRYDIEPGDPDTSILLHRLTSTDPGVRMPTVGRSLVHEEGAELIREWIQSMSPHPTATADPLR